MTLNAQRSTPKLRFSLIIALAGLISLPSFANQYDKNDKSNNASDKSFHFDSQQLGFTSPLVIGAGYDTELGTKLDARYSQLLNENSAYSLGLELGENSYRGSATLGHQFTEADRAKITAEALRQKQEYTFRSGTTKEWLNQQAIGVEYQHLNPNKPFSEFHIAASHVKADSKNLSDLSYLTETNALYEVFNNERRLAGTKQNSIKAGVTASPRTSTKLQLDLHYDDVKYDTQLSGNATSYRGVGTTLGWTEQLNNKTSLNLIATAREPYTRYQAQINRQLNKRLFGQPTSLQIAASHQVGNHGLEDDTRGTIRLSFGAKDSSNLATSATTKPPANNTKPPANHNELLNWTSKPAVYESRILATADQKAADERLVVASKADLLAANASINKNGDITLNAVNAIAINNVTENGQALNFSSQQFRLDAGKLVIGMANLNTPSRYFVALEQANGQFTHISFTTFTGSVGLGFLNITPDQASPNQADSGLQFAADITDGGSIRVNENSQVSIGTQSAFTGVGLSFVANGLPSGLSINASIGVITGTTGEVDGVDSVSSAVTVTATAGDGSVQAVRFTVVVVNLDGKNEVSDSLGLQVKAYGDNVYTPPEDSGNGGVAGGVVDYVKQIDSTTIELADDNRLFDNQEFAIVTGDGIQTNAIFSIESFNVIESYSSLGVLSIDQSTGILSFNQTVVYFGLPDKYQVRVKVTNLDGSSDLMIFVLIVSSSPI